MLTGVTLQNVRLFADKRFSFNLAPITVFCGTNSSGKSTVLKTIPLLRQSQGIRENSEDESAKLRFKGSQLDLGNFYTFVSNNDVTKPLTLGLHVSTPLQQNFVEYLRFVTSRTSDEPPAMATEGSVHEGSVSVHFTFTAEAPIPTSGIQASDVSLSARTLGSLSTAEFEIQIAEERLFTWSIERLPQAPSVNELPLGTNFEEASQKLYQLKLPRPFFDKSLGKYVRAQTSPTPDHALLICAIKGLMPSVIVAQANGESSPAADQDETWSRWPLPGIIEWQLNQLRGALYNIHYVAPVRSPGKRYYVADLDTSPGMDPTGEFLPHILRDKSAHLVLNCGPDGTPMQHSLATALSTWLYYLRTGKPNFSESGNPEFQLTTENILVELKVQSPQGSNKHSLADSGFGYSQIVPIIVRGLMTPPDGTLIVEQPELHLHPALQVRLADFFTAMAHLGKQIIVETHSEHLVNALRVRVAEDPTNTLHKSCRIYFLHTDAAHPRTYDLSVKPDGSLNEWPSCFFGEALGLSSRLLRAQRKMRQGS